MILGPCTHHAPLRRFRIAAECDEDDGDCEVERNMEKSRQSKTRRRKGLATLDYVLLLGVIMPLAVFLFRVGPLIIRLVYEMECALVSWPFM